MDLTADERSAMARVPKTAGNGRIEVALGSAGKDRPLKSHPAKSFSPRSARKTGKSALHNKCQAALKEISLHSK